jgi:uncharacterized membrane protein YcaP (DUF421 family)
MDPQDLLITALRASIIYFFLLLIIRLLGKRSIGNFGAFDLIVALMLGEVVDEAIYGDVTMLKAGLVILVIAAWTISTKSKATLEPKGQISVLKEEWAEPIQKKDLPE